MRIVKLTQESKKTLLNDLLKRSPNNYGQYEKVVADIIADARAVPDQTVAAHAGRCVDGTGDRKYIPALL